MKTFDTEELKRKYPVGHEFRYCNRNFWRVVMYFEDDGSEYALIKTVHDETERMGWRVEDIQVFAYTVDLMAREYGERKGRLYKFKKQE